jgi:hypothetical protein
MTQLYTQFHVACKLELCTDDMVGFSGRIHGFKCPIKCLGQYKKRD